MDVYSATLVTIKSGMKKSPGYQNDESMGGVM
jgi:hypothetical protein